MGENDAYLETLEDETVVKKEGELRRCLYCGKIRIGNADVCIYCRRADRTKAGIVLILLLFAVAMSFLAAMLIPLKNEVHPPRVPLPQGLQHNLDRLHTLEAPVPVVSWHAAFLEESCALCPDCCSSVVPDALGPLDAD